MITTFPVDLMGVKLGSSLLARTKLCLRTEHTSSVLDYLDLEHGSKKFPETPATILNF
jgi:hypothetical protein